MAKQIYIDENGNPIEVSGTINTAELLPISGNDPTDTKSYIDGITKSKVIKFSESKTSNYGVVTTNIPVTKCLLGYYFGSYGLIPYKHSSGNWYFNVVNAENGYIVPKIGETDTLTVYYFSFDVT